MSIAFYILRIVILFLLVSEVGLARASSSSDPGRLSLPRGPGSIEGLGRSFTTSQATGTASYGVDIALPPGAAGFSPRLSLEYDAGFGVSEVGMGWRLGGLPRIQRRVDEGLPRFDGEDTFEWAGGACSSPLVEVATRTYRPQFECGSFLRVRRSSDGASWEAKDKAGITYRFGGSVEQEEGRTVSFLLREMEDLHHHRATFEWDVAKGVALLRRIVWNNYGPDLRHEVLLSYEPRADVHLLFAKGIRQELRDRLVAIEVLHGGQRVRRYALSYASGVHSRLSRITVLGTDGRSARPALSFGYTEVATSDRVQVATMVTPPGRSPSDADVDLVDLNGDSLPDLLVTEPGAFRSYVNHDGREWKAGTDWSAANSPSVSLASAGVELADVNGDGSLDLLAQSAGGSFRYFPSSSGTTFGPALSLPMVPNIKLDDPDVRLVDMDGDRRVDIVVSTPTGLAIGYNRHGLEWGVPKLVGPVDAQQSLRFSDGGHTQLCEVNGDGVMDVCYLRSGGLVYWLGRGRGHFVPSAPATGVPTFDEASPWELRDLNGDGWVDLVHVGIQNLEVALAEGIGRFGPVKTFEGMPRKGPGVVHRYADMNGSGTTDIVWVDASAGPAVAWRYLELFPEGRAGLLNRIENGLGQVTGIRYRPAAMDAARARSGTSPGRPG